MIVAEYYWWAECDSCGARSPHEESEINAWATKDQARHACEEEGWLVVRRLDGGVERVLCERCSAGID